MDNARLKVLVGLYFNCNEQLSIIRGQVEKNSIEIQLLNDIGALLTEEIKNTKDNLRKISLQKLIAGFITEKLTDAHLKADESVRVITSPDKEKEIAYLEARLESIKSLLGKENCQEIERYEKEKIQKNK